MTIETAELKATPARVRRLAQLGYLDRAALARGLRLTGGIPDRRGWARFIDYLLLALGALFFVAGLFFFVAYNWEDLPRFARFGILEGAIVVIAAIAQWSGLSRLGGKIALTVAALLVGALLAVFGQEYQSGADSYTLFGNWALLIAGWVLIGNFDVLWGVWLGLLNLTLALFWNQLYPGDQYPQPETLFLLNAVALLVWELIARRASWWRQRWLQRITAIVAFGWILGPTLEAIFNLFADYDGLPLIHQFGPLIYGLFLLLVLFVYIRLQPDLFMVTVALFSVIIVLTTFIASGLADSDEVLAYFVAGFAVILQAGVAVTILRRIAHGWEEQA